MKKILSERDDPLKYHLRNSTLRQYKRFGFTKEDVKQEIALEEAKRGRFAPMYTRFHLANLLKKFFTKSRLAQDSITIPFDELYETLFFELDPDRYRNEDMLCRQEEKAFVEQVAKYIEENEEFGEDLVKIFRGEIDQLEIIKKHGLNKSFYEKVRTLKKRLKNKFEAQYRATF